MAETIFTDATTGLRYLNVETEASPTAMFCDVCHQKHPHGSAHLGHHSDWRLNENTKAWLAEARAGQPSENALRRLGRRRCERLREEELERLRREAARVEQERAAAEKADRERLEAEQAERDRKEAAQAARRARAESRVTPFDTLTAARSALVEAYLALDEIEQRVAALEAKEAR